MIKIFGLGVVGIILVSVLTGCGSTVAQLSSASQDTTDSEATVQVLNFAENINVNKAVISFGDSWSVSAGGSQVAEIKGQVIPVLGDTYGMNTMKGNLVGSEAEQIIRFLPGATLFDEKNVVRGEISQELTLLFQKFTFTNADGKIVGTAEQKLGFTLNFDIVNSAGVVEYSVNKALFSFGDSLDISRKVTNPTISAVDAVWLAVIVNELNASSNNTKNSK